MHDSKPWYRRPRLWLSGAVVLIVVGAALAILVRTQAAPPQPFAYNHAAHIAKGIPCMFCHAGAIQGQTAGLPTKAKCQGCHNNMAADTPELKAWADYASAHKAIEWVPVALLPDFVYFTHRPHLAAGVNCETCHGNLAEMSTAQPQRNHNMGWCLSCHKERAPEKFVKLSDCATCHK